MLRLLVFMLFWPFAALADGVLDLSEDMRAQMVARPERFEASAAGLILGYGTAAGIDGRGVENYLAVERAKTRVREVRRMLLADLDDDAAVSLAEVFVVMAAEGAAARGRLWQVHKACDAGGDGTATWAEMQAQARRVAARAEGREAGIRDLMQLDFDRDGFVTMEELRQAMMQIAPET